MFDSLDEQMKHDDQVGTTARERLCRWVTVCVVSIAVFGGLFLVVRWMGVSG